MRHEVKGKLLLPVDWSPMGDLDLATVPTDGREHDAVLYMEDSAWPYEAKLDTYLEKARTHYAPSLEQRSERSLLTLLAVFQAALGAPRRREVILWQRVDFPERLPGLFTRELPGAREGPGHVDARRARSARRLGEPAAAQRGLVAARADVRRAEIAATRSCSGTGRRTRCRRAGHRGSGHSPLNMPQSHVMPGTTHACTIQTSVSSVLRPPIAAHCWRVDSSPRDDDAALEAQPAVRVVLVPAVVRAREAGRRTVRCATRGSSARRSSSRGSCPSYNNSDGCAGSKCRRETDVRVVRADARHVHRRHRVAGGHGVLHRRVLLRDRLGRGHLRVQRALLGRRQRQLLRPCRARRALPPRPRPRS